jgi:hypothetical protein
MRAAWVWAAADIRRRWVPLLWLAIIVAVAVGSVLTLAAGARRAGTAVDRWATATELPDVLVNTGPEPAELLSALASDPRIERVERADMVVVAPAPMEPGTAGFTVVGTAGSMTGGFGRPLLVAGRYPDVSSSDEIIINERAAATYRLRAGQRVQLRTIECPDDCPTRPVGEATIVGIVRLPTDLLADPQVTGVAFGSPAFLDGRWRDALHLAAWLGVHVRNEEDLDAVVADLSVRVTDGDVVGTGATMAPVDRAGQWQRNALAIAAAIVSLASVLVVIQALSRHLAGRPGDPHVLAAVGLTVRERSAAGVMSVMPAIAGGIAGGVVLAVAVSPLLPLGVIRRADPDIGFHADTVAVVLGGVAALAALTAAASVAAVRWATRHRSSVVGPTPSIAGRLAAAVGRRPVPATGIQFALAPSRGSTWLPVLPTVVTLVGVAAVLAGALVVRWSLDGLLGDGDRYGQSHHLLVGLADEDTPSQARELARDPRVQGVTISRQGRVGITTGDGTTLQVAATGLESVGGPIPVTVLEGRAPTGPREIALASATMVAAALRPGDRTMASGPCGEFAVEVVGRVIVPLTGSNYPDDGSILTLDAFDELCAQDNIATLDVNSSALVRLRDPAATAAVRDEWRAEGRYVQDPETPWSIGFIREVRAVPVLVGVVVAFLWTATVAHTLILTVRRRRRDLAVLRALGLRPRQAGGVVGWQALTLVAVALAVGVPLGLVAGRTVWTAIAGASNVVVRIDLRPVGLAALAAGVALIAAAAAIWPARYATRLRPTDALGSE